MPITAAHFCPHSASRSTGNDAPSANDSSWAGEIQNTNCLATEVTVAGPGAVACSIHMATPALIDPPSNPRHHAAALQVIFVNKPPAHHFTHISNRCFLFCSDSSRFVVAMCAPFLFSLWIAPVQQPLRPARFATYYSRRRGVPHYPSDRLFAPLCPVLRTDVAPASVRPV